MSAGPLRTVTGVAAPLLRSNIDTDVIIRVERMVSAKPADLAPWAFEAMRYRPDGSEDPGFVLNQEPFRDAPILVAGSNFGCGSSREPAVWAIAGLGIRCIVAPSYGDIFEANCHQNGILPIVLSEAEVDDLATLAATGVPVTVDLEAQQVRSADCIWPFVIGPSQKLALLEGLDDLDLARSQMDAIRNWEHADRTARPWAWAPVRQDAVAKEDRP